MDEAKAIKKLDLFISKETSKQLMGIQESVGRVKDKTERKPVPGSAGKSYLLAADFITDTLADLVRFFVELHYLQLSFDGNLTLDDIFRTLSGSIRVLATAELKLKESRLAAEKNDMRSLSKSIRGTLFDGKALPTDISHLLDLLENHYSPDLWLAIYFHPGLLKQGEKLAQFGLLYMSYRFVEKTDPVKYARIIARMPHCKTDEYHWKYKALDNDYLESILFYNQDKIHPLSRNYNPNPPKPNPKQMGRTYQLPKLNATDAARIQRAMKADPNLAQNARMHPMLRAYVLGFITSGLPPIAIDPAGDHELLIKLVLDDMSQYKNGGDAMLRDMRNSSQHIPDAFLQLVAQLVAAQPAAAMHGAQAGPAPASAAQLASTNQPAAMQGTKAAAAAAPAAAPEFHEVESIFGEQYPGALCEFFMAMVSEKEVAYLKDVQTYLSYFSQ